MSAVNTDTIGRTTTARQGEDTPQNSTGSRPQSLSILGVRVHRVTMEETVRLLRAMSENGGTHHVVTVNPEFVMTAQRNESFRRVLNNADLAIPDGMGIVLASRLLGMPVPERVTGIDMIERFARIASERSIRLFLLGAGPGVAERAAQVLCARFPGLLIAGTYSGSPRPEDDDEICKRILSSSPDVLLVAFGSPNQDLWIARMHERLSVPVSIGVGGAFDFLAGVVQRAPWRMRTVGLEWLYRLIQEPVRWRRMLALPRFALLVLVQWFHTK